MSVAASRSGRRPKPVAQKLLAGNPGGRPLNVNQPDFALVNSVDCPVWMGEFGRELWQTLSPQLCKEKILAATDIQNLEAYCSAYDQFRVSEAHLAIHGVVVEGSHGGMIKNPAATAKSEALRHMATYSSMLGLDPSSRQRLVGATKSTEGNTFAGLLQ